jgi:predicted  nucleic acid-binding Zn-ribbon protein
VQETLGILRELQELDQELNEKRQSRKKLAAEQAEITSELNRVQEMVDALKGNIAELDAQRRDFSHDLVIEEGNVAKAESRLPTIKTQREYVAVLKEVDTAKKMNKDIQDKIAALDLQMEALNNECQEKEDELAQIKSEVQDRQKEIESALGEADKILGEGDGRRDDFLGKISSSLRKRYEMLLDKRAGVAIVEARQETCFGCNMNLPPQLFNRLYTTKEILTCPHCNRMLYLDLSDS